MNTTAETSSAPSTTQPMKIMLLLIGLIVGAVLGLAIVLRIDPVITMPDELGAWPLSPSAEYMQRYNQAYSNMWMGNLAINFAIIGLATGTITTCLLSRGVSLTGRLLLPILTLVGGGLAGLLTGLMLASAHGTQGRLDVFGWQLDPMLQAVLFQTIVWSGIGVGLGAGVALSLRKPIGKCIAGGILGGFAAAVLHALLGSIIFPTSDMANLLPPNTVERFIWAAYSAACLGGGIWWSLRPKSA